MAEIAPPRLLESLPARPPTPPRETHNEADASRKLLAAGRGSSLDPRTSLQTPPSAPSLPSSNNKTGSIGSARQKKVEFSLQADYKEPPVYPDNAGSSAGRQGQVTPPVVALPPSSSASRPAKSILKVTTYETVISTNPSNIADMLASTIQQLAGADRESRLDAYLMLARALKTSDNLPDRIALQSKMSLFTQFIQRDVTAPRTPEGTFDSTLVIAALSLLSTFLRFSAIASTLSNDFGVFIIDHCIRSFEASNAPRDVLRALMRVVALQTFPAKVMTSDRVGRLVAALHNMDEQYESKKTIVMRSIIYRTLVKNNKMLMVVHLDWLPDLLADMLSTVPDIREGAISLGLEAAFALGRERPVSQRVMELLQATVDDERYLDYYANHLRAMTKNKNESCFVPQVWSVVTLFLRALEKWDFFINWLRIIQDCFNSGDYRTKVEANYAWSRFTYALLRDDRALSRKMTAVLTQALVTQLRRRGMGKHADDLRRVVLGCVGNLIYYTMRDTTGLDNIWDNTIKPVVLQLLERSAAEEATREKRKSNLASACIMLTGLVDCSTTRPWTEDHITKSPVVAPEDLPAVDAKWIRRNGNRVFALVCPILEQGFAELSTPRSATQVLWRSVVGAVSAAAAKEVKVSPETAAFVGHAFSLFLKLWTAGVPPQNNAANATANAAANGVAKEPDNAFSSAQFLAAAREYLLTMVDSLGCLPFTEKQLSRDEGSIFVPVATPSQRAGKGYSVSRTPLRHLFSILTSLPPGVSDDDDFADFVESIFAPFFSAKSDRGRRTLAYEMLQMAPMDALCPYGPWQVAATRIASSLALPSSAGSGGGSGSKGGNSDSIGNGHHYHRMSLSPGSGNSDTVPVGHGYREVVRVLERGLRSTPRLPWSRWQALFCTLCDRVREDAGEAGLAMCVLDPLAKTIIELRLQPTTTELSSTASRAAVELVSLASHPRDRQAVDAAKRRLWGPAVVVSGQLAPFDPFDQLYKLVNSVLLQCYSEFDPQSPESAEFGAALLKELAGFFTRSNEQLFVKALSAVQDSLACWIQDEATKLSRQFAITRAVDFVREAVCSVLERTCDPASIPLGTLETLFCALFSSKHRYVVNSALALWNSIFGGHVGVVDYPEKLNAALTTLQAFVDVPILGLDVAHIESSGGAQQPMFVDSQDDVVAIATLSSTEPNSNELDIAMAHSAPSERREALTPLATTSPSFVNKIPHVSGADKPKQQDKARRDKPRSTPPRPRHDDSQIEFTAIDTEVALPSSSRSASAAAKDNDNGVVAVEESQILTDRQREVRDRQRETSALYSDIMSSSPGGDATSRRLFTRSAAPPGGSSISLPQHTIRPNQEPEKLLSLVPDDVALPEQPRAATPEPAPANNNQQSGRGGTFADEDFIASTPTPRRGQALVFPVVNDSETDPPSSPPEPRRHPLLSEISSRSRSSSILDDWQFSSSPLSGSPIAARHTNPEPELSLAGALEARMSGSTRGGQGHEEMAVGGGSKTTDELELQQSSPSPAVPRPPVSDRSKDTDVVMEDAPAPVLAAPAVAEQLCSDFTVEISPVMQDKTISAVPTTPMQTRRRSALSRETSQNSQTFGAPPVESDSPWSSVPASAPRSLPRALRKNKKSVSRALAQSSPVRGSSSSRSRRYKLMAMPPPSMHDLSFRMSDGEERSMLRLAIEMDMLNKKSQPTKATTALSTRSSTSSSNISSNKLGSAVNGNEALDCITVWTNDDREDPTKSEGRGASSPQESSQESSQRTPSQQRSRRRKRKHSAASRAGDDVAETPSKTSPKARQYARATRRRSEPISSPARAPSPIDDAADTTADVGLSSPGKSSEHLPVVSSRSPSPAVSSSVPEDEQVHSQLALELEVHGNRDSMGVTSVIDLTAMADVTAEVVEVSDEADAAAAAAAEPDSVIEVGEDGREEGGRPAKKPRLAGILSMLRGSLTLLQAATLSREDVSQIEDVCMDVKRALYDAERRGRGE